jgi:hypothetical protein
MKAYPAFLAARMRLGLLMWLLGLVGVVDGQQIAKTTLAGSRWIHESDS